MTSAKPYCKTSEVADIITTREATPTTSFDEIKAMFESAATKAVDSVKELYPEKD